MFASIPSATVLGATGQPVRVEVHVGNGVPSFTIVGLPDEACREARDRARAAVVSSGLTWPNKRITVNLAPSDVRKGGTSFDLPLAIGVLVAAHVLSVASVEGLGFLGELGLDGSIRRVAGIAPMAAAIEAGTVVVGRSSFAEAVAARDGEVRAVACLAELVAALIGESPWPPSPRTEDVPEPPPPPDLAEVRGQPVARRALEIAAAGGHHLLFVGPPGAGKTMLAQRLPGLLPPLGRAEALEVTMIGSAAGLAPPPGGLVRHPPWRAPHHSVSLVAMVGGGTANLRPGEISLAHRGVLFLDELGEFAPAVLDSLRQPLEDGCVRISRARASAVLPAEILLVAATNPCPCGGGPPGACSCGEAARARYLRRLSGPILDRFDLRVALDRASVDDLLDERPAEPSSVVRTRVLAARQVALDRQGRLNRTLTGRDLDEFAPLTPDAKQLLEAHLERGRLTARGLLRIRRSALTITDFEAPGTAVGEDAVALALAMRSPLDHHLVVPR